MARLIFLEASLLTMFVSIQCHPQKTHDWDDWSAEKELPPVPPTIQQLPPIPPHLTLPPIPLALSLPPIPPMPTFPPIQPKKTFPPPLPVGTLPPIPPIPTLPPFPPVPPIITTSGLKNMKCGTDKMEDSVKGGSESIPNSWIWQGAIYDQGRFICSGALITSNLFLTAKKCVPNDRAPGSILVRLGDHQRDMPEGGEQEISVEKIVRHDASDIALIKLEKDAVLNDEVGIVCLPEQDEDDNSIFGKECYTTGWGVVTATQSSNNFLTEARTKPVPIEQCVKNAIESKKTDLSSTDAILCGKFRDSNNPACYGDVGGPFVCKSLGKWVLEGVRNRRVNECSSTDHYTVFTKVKRYISWIEQMAMII